jgi:hypothetical protein
VGYLSDPGTCQLWSGAVETDGTIQGERRRTRNFGDTESDTIVRSHPNHIRMLGLVGLRTGPRLTLVKLEHFVLTAIVSAIELATVTQSGPHMSHKFRPRWNSPSRNETSRFANRLRNHFMHLVPRPRLYISPSSPLSTRCICLVNMKHRQLWRVVCVSPRLQLRQGAVLSYFNTSINDQTSTATCVDRPNRWVVHRPHLQHALQAERQEIRNSLGCADIAMTINPRVYHINAILA